MNFPVVWAAEKISTKEGGIMLRLRSVDNLYYTIENEHSAYISHTQKYLVKHVDMANGKMIRQFTRKYRSIAYFPDKEDKKTDTVGGYKRDFFPDIEGISLYKGKVWIFTSTLDKQKGVLVDIFSPDGKYLDNFYLPLPGILRPDSFEESPFAISGDYIFIVEKDADDNLCIVKYKIDL
jgi:hypothetical protein